MFALSLILAAGSLSTLISGAPVPASSSLQSLQERSGNSYTTYGGNGEVSEGWPSQSDWVANFDDMFTSNIPIMTSSCSQWSVPDTTDAEAADIKSAISSVASSTGIDPRFILAIMMQESNGCVRVPTTNYGVRNPGLMQSHDGSGTCNDGSVQTPCPSSEITQMIQDGAGGTSQGDGLKQTMAQAGGSDVSTYYKAARIYNSGSIDASGNLGAGIATHCYASDIANRLTGWASGASTCDPATVGSLTGTASSSSPTNGNPATTTTPAVVASTPAAAPAPTATTAAAPPPEEPANIGSSLGNAGGAGSSSAPSSSADVYSGATSSCQEWHTVVSGDNCWALGQQYGVSLSQLQSWNSGLDGACSNLWLGYQYCVKA